MTEYLLLAALLVACSMGISAHYIFGIVQRGEGFSWSAMVRPFLAAPVLVLPILTVSFVGSLWKLTVSTTLLVVMAYSAGFLWPTLLDRAKHRAAKDGVVEPILRRILASAKRSKTV